LPAALQGQSDMQKELGTRIYERLPVMEVARLVADYLTPLQYNRQLFLALPRHQNTVTALCYFPAYSYLASSSPEGTIIWDLSQPGISTIVQRISTNSNKSVCAVGRSRLATVSYNKIEVRDFHEPEDARSLVGHRMQVTSICEAGAQHLASTSDDGTIRVWDLSQEEGCESVGTLHGSDGAVSTVCALGGGRLASVSFASTINVWEGENGTWECSHTLHGHKSCVTSLCALDFGRLASCSSDGTIKVWDLIKGTWRCTQTLIEQPPYTISSVRALGNNRLASICNKREVGIWDLAGGKCIQRLPTPAEVNTVCAAGDGRLALGLDDGEVRIWHQ
jgi:WD40 repeat protein